MTPENVADCKAIFDTLTAEPMPGVTAELAHDGSLEIEFFGVPFVLRQGQWFGNGVAITCRLLRFQIERASAVHKEIGAVGGMMAIAADKPNPQHAADLAKIAAALGYTGVMTGVDPAALAGLAKRVKAEEAVECSQRLFEIHQALGAPLTAQQEDVIAAITAMRKTDPLGQLGAPATYDNGQALTVKERLLYLLARIP